MAEAAPKPSSSGQTTNVMRNIIVSVTSTVMGATIIYFLGFHNRGKTGDSFLEKKEATTSAWKSYTAYENAYSRNSLSYEKEVAAIGLDAYFAGILKESEKFEKDMTQLMKGEGIDNDLLRALTRRLENNKNSMPKLKEYIETMKKIIADTSSDEIRQNAYIAEETRWINYNKGSFERAVNEIQEIGKTLTERYGQPFSLDDFLVFQQFDQRMKTADSSLEAFKKMQAEGMDTSYLVKPGEREYAKKFTPKDIVGKWGIEDMVLYITDDGKINWIMEPDNKLQGTWKIEKNKLIMNLVVEKTQNRVLWSFRVARLKPDSFTLMVDGETMTPFLLVRLPD